MKQDEFFKELDNRLRENKKLQVSGGLPKEMAPIVYVLGMYPWQSLATGATLLMICCWLADRLLIIKIVRVLLFMG